MYMRLAFAVAAHLEPEVLVVDEVLAVGDAEFQKKCLGKMGEVAKEGRTVLFVSHNMAAITSLCRRGIVLQRGQGTFRGTSRQAVEHYLGTQSRAAHADLSRRVDRHGNGRIRFSGAWVEDDLGNVVDTVCSGQDIRLVAEYHATEQLSLRTLSVAYALNSSLVGQLTDLWSETAGTDWKHVAPSGKVVCRLPRLPLNTGRYTFNICARVNTIIADFITEAAAFEVVPGDYFPSARVPDENQGCFLFDQEWMIETLCVESPVSGN
jgi:lipopolysaccharide transport system ATP-binding protein